MLNSACKSIAYEMAKIQRAKEYTESMDSDDIVEDAF